MDHTKRNASAAIDEAFMSEIDRGWDECAQPATAAAGAAPTARPPMRRRETDRCLKIDDLFAALGDTPYAKQMRERGPKKPIERVPFTLDPTPRRTGASTTEYKVFPNEEETPFLLTVRKGLRRRGEGASEAAE
jgi:hypothetical protein